MATAEDARFQTGMRFELSRSPVADQSGREIDCLADVATAAFFKQSVDHHKDFWRAHGFTAFGSADAGLRSRLRASLAAAPDAAIALLRSGVSLADLAFAALT